MKGPACYQAQFNSTETVSNHLGSRHGRKDKEPANLPFPVCHFISIDIYTDHVESHQKQFMRGWDVLG